MNRENEKKLLKISEKRGLGNPRKDPILKQIYDMLGKSEKEELDKLPEEE